MPWNPRAPYAGRLLYLRYTGERKNHRRFPLRQLLENTDFVRSAAWIPALLLAAGLVVAGWVLGSEIKAIKLADRYVTIKGLVERKVKSDLAIWPLSYKETGDDLAGVYALMKTVRVVTTIDYYLDK